jgi:hypothetical protein
LKLDEATKLMAELMETSEVLSDEDMMRVFVKVNRILRLESQRPASCYEGRSSDWLSAFSQDGFYFFSDVLEMGWLNCY